MRTEHFIIWRLVVIFILFNLSACSLGHKVCMGTLSSFSGSNSSEDFGG
ncbi:hypothetical protein [Cardinium endosymbiont of Nabis limbatus]